MPRYFFNLRYGPDKLSVDYEGDEIRDDTFAREHAIHVARKLVTTRSHAVRDWMTCSFEVMDQDRQLLFSVPFDAIAADAASRIDPENL